MTIRLRQAVIAARDLDAVAQRLRDELGLGEPYADPAVSYFGLRNAVFVLGDTFLEVVSPMQDGTAAGRFLDRRGDDGGYMLMFQVADVAAARARARELGVREVLEVANGDIEEAHLHPADMRAAIVSVSQPEPAASWCWGGPDWDRRGAPLTLAGARVAVADPTAARSRWDTILGAPAGTAGVTIDPDPTEPGLVELAITGLTTPTTIAGVHLTPPPSGS